MSIIFNLGKWKKSLCVEKGKLWKEWKEMRLEKEVGARSHKSMVVRPGSLLNKMRNFTKHQCPGSIRGHL